MVKMFLGIGDFIRIFIFVGFFTLVSCGSKDDHSLSVTDYSIILQLILDHKDLQLYYHQELPERSQVSVVTHNRIPVGLDVQKFGLAVEFIDSTSDIAKFDVNRFEVQLNRIYFSLLYEVEGVRIIGEASRADGGWVLSAVEVSEG